MSKSKVKSKKTEISVDEFFEKKGKSSKKTELVEKEDVVIKPTEEKSIGRIIFDVVFWIFICGLFVLWIYEIVLAKNDKDPVLCFNKKIHQFEDGTVTECNGIGYQTFEYNRSSINITRQLSAFFIGMRE